MIGLMFQYVATPTLPLADRNAVGPTSEPLNIVEFCIFFFSFLDNNEDQKHGYN